MGNRTLVSWGLGCALALLHVRAAHAEEPTAKKAAEKQSEQSLSELAEEAYAYGYPLVLIDETVKVGTNVARPHGTQAPINQIVRVDVLPDAKFNTVVLPNVDTLYTAGFLDLSAEPMVLHIPDTQGRYYLMPMLDAYSNVFASPGKRTTGTGDLKVAIVGPNFQGSLPAGLSKIQAPTDRVWLLGRTQINGEEDVAKVVALTDKYTITPLSAWGKPYSPPAGRVDPAIDMTTPPPKTVAKLSDRAYFERLAALLAKYPPPPADHDALARFEKLGLAPGRFTPSPAAAKAIQGTGARASKQIKKHVKEMGAEHNGWRVPKTSGSYGTRYDDRAAIAMWALGANLREDAIYPAAALDAEGKPLNGKDKYVIHFARGEEPPANAFWSLTMYSAEGYFVDNPLNRYAIGNRDDLQRNPDGSLDLWIQHDAPEASKQANWLPAPKGPFQLLMRLYWPKEVVVTDKWAPPSVQRVKR